MLSVIFKKVSCYKNRDIDTECPICKRRFVESKEDEKPLENALGLIGGKREFTENINDELLESYCVYVGDSKIVCNNGHIFCKSCSENISEKCPICNELILENPIKIVDIYNFVCGVGENSINTVNLTNYLGEKKIYSDACLIYATQGNNYDEVRMLIYSGANVNFRYELGWTALHWACYDGYLEIAKLLIDSGADVNILNDAGSSPLYWACVRANLKTVELLIKSGAKCPKKELYFIYHTEYYNKINMKIKNLINEIKN